MTPAADRAPGVSATRPEALILVAVALAILLGHRAQLRHEPGIAMDATRGYRATADLLAARGCLKLGGLPDDKGRALIVYEPREGCPDTKAFNAYRKASPLSGDMASLVDQRWVIGQGALAPQLRGIRANSHEVRFANDRKLLWTDSVNYAGESANGPSPPWEWVSGDIVHNVAPRCANRLVDGKPSTGPLALHQYVQCDGYAWQTVAPIRALSETTGSARRVRDAALADVLRRLEVPNMSGDFATTIQRPLQRAMQADLRGHLHGVDTRRKKDKTVRAGILLMNGLTGEIAAAATFPLRKEDVRDARNESWRWRNWNFERLPVGSTAKIPFAAAIIQAIPRLAGTSPDSNHVPTGFCGEGKGSGVCRSRARSNVGVGFEKFIAVSSNGHALWLLGQARRSTSPAWMDNLRKFACIEPQLHEREPSCSGYLWRSDRPGSGLQARGVEEPLLQLDMEHPHGESLFASVYLDILGGNRSSWTTPNLAQAYARIFSDTEVNPRLTPHDAKIGSLGIDPKVWRLVRDGMAAVLMPDGTGHKICDAIKCSANRVGTTWLYAKTGTSTIADLAPSDDGETGDNGKILVLLAVKTATGAAPALARDIRDLRVTIITQRYSSPGKDAIDLAVILLRDRRYRQWMGLDADPSGTRGDKGNTPARTR